MVYVIDLSKDSRALTCPTIANLTVNETVQPIHIEELTSESKVELETFIRDVVKDAEIIVYMDNSDGGDVPDILEYLRHNNNIRVAMYVAKSI